MVRDSGQKRGTKGETAKGATTKVDTTTKTGETEEDKVGQGTVTAPRGTDSQRRLGKTVRDFGRTRGTKEAKKGETPAKGETTKTEPEEDKVGQAAVTALRAPDSERLSVLVKRIDKVGVRGLVREFHLEKEAERERLGRSVPGRSITAFLANPRKNRYDDIKIWDETRVRVSGTSGLRGDYVHANWAYGVDGTRRYILAQGPLTANANYDDTQPDFWAMIWEHHITVVLMLCATVEQGRNKCAEYWPIKKGDAVLHGDFAVKCMGMESIRVGEHTVMRRELILTPVAGQASGHRRLSHYQYADWPDFKCPPSAEPLIGFLKAVREKAAALADQNGIRRERSPLLVHCSAGIGRSGTLVAMDMALTLIAEGEDPIIDVPRIVRCLRLGRLFAIQTGSQYIAVYQAVIDFFRLANRLPRNFDLRRFNCEIIAFSA